ncbi:family 10 glycosylhydrolase, partial [candidate division KSB1 bacterium]|nr:family 10 glycosylhydrolase [candidate division KSB1 bacterium]
MKKNIIVSVIFICLLLSVTPSNAQEKEFRGVWVAWAGTNVPSREYITEMMEDIAAHHMNTVYVDVWRFGYPYFISDLFYKHTGLYTDPALPSGRDVLAEMIVEGHRVGLHVEAWFEYGFVACQGNNDVFYQRYPDWFAKKRNGSVLFNGNYQYRWLSHCHPNAQQFLIDLCQEVALKYDIDGVELDRVRYPELDCGYDSVTIELYKQEHAGAAPPQTMTNPEWMRWRAAKLTEFTTALYDSLKRIRSDLPISNAPIVYPYGYDNFCQDWRPWINDGYLDIISPQVYRSTNSAYSSELIRQMSYVSDYSGFYPGLTSITDSYLLPTSEIIAMIRTTREQGLDGHVIWFYDTLADDLPILKNEVYPIAVTPPGRPDGWRRPAIIIHEDADNVTRSAGWTPYSTISGFDGGCLYTNSSNDEWIDYHADIEVPDWYEIYVYNIYHWNGVPGAPYEIFHDNGADTVYLGQNKPVQSEWQKLGDFYFGSGMNKRILRLSNRAIVNRLLFADAIMLLNSNRMDYVNTGVRINEEKIQPDGFRLNQNYPNPFNPETKISFYLDEPDHVRLKVYDLLGKEVVTLIDENVGAGDHAVVFRGGNLASGIYLYHLTGNDLNACQKMLLIK